MKMDVGMTLEPAVVFGLMSIEVIENDMDFSVVAVRIDEPIHEIQGFPWAAAIVMASPNQTGGGFQSHVKRGWPVPSFS